MIQENDDSYRQGGEDDDFADEELDEVDDLGLRQQSNTSYDLDRQTF